MQMGANGIETDVRRTKDGVLVLFHDEDLRRVTGQEGKISDYTYEELKTFNVKKGDIHDKIPTLEDFLDHFAYRDITFAIELKDNDIEKEVADLIFKYGIEKKTVITAFELERIRKIKEYAPTLRVGYLTNLLNDNVINKLIKIGADEYCPYSQTVTAETAAMLHRLGFNVRAWGISDEATMKQVYDAGADGMTVNFPDKLLQYIAQKNEE